MTERLRAESTLGDNPALENAGLFVIYIPHLVHNRDVEGIQHSRQFRYLR